MSGTNGSWDCGTRAQCSAWVNALSAPEPPAVPAAGPQESPWWGADFFYHLAQTDPDRANGYTPFCYDELHEPATHPWQTREKFRQLAIRATVPSYVAVAWTLTPGMQDLVLGIGDGYAANPASALKIAQEFFVFGEDGPEGGEAMLAQFEWYRQQGLLSRLVPCYNVANAPHKNDKAYRPFSVNPGLVSDYWRRLMTRCRDAGIYDAWVWGAGYLHIGEAYGRQGAAMRAWDHVLASVFYAGAADPRA